MRKIISSIIITIITCLLIIFIKNEYSYLLLKNASYGIPALIHQKEVENLYLGSSMFRQGLDINTLETSNSSSHYILAYNGNQPALEYYQLKYLLEQNLQIEHLYLDMYVYSAWEEPKISDEKLFLEINLTEKWKLWKLIKNQQFNRFNAFWRMFVSSNNELLLTWPINSLLINKQFHNGGTLTITNGASDESLKSFMVPSIVGSMNQTQKYYLKEIIKLAREYSINLTFIETPKYEKVALDTSYLQAMSSYIQFAEEEHIPYIISNSTQSYITNTSTLLCTCYSFDIYESDNFMDAIHLSARGRIAFSKKLFSY